MADQRQIKEGHILVRGKGGALYEVPMADLEKYQVPEEEAKAMVGPRGGGGRRGGGKSGGKSGGQIVVNVNLPGGRQMSMGQPQPQPMEQQDVVAHGCGYNSCGYNSCGNWGYASCGYTSCGYNSCW